MGRNCVLEMFNLSRLLLLHSEILHRSELRGERCRCEKKTNYRSEEGKESELIYVEWRRRREGDLC